MRKIIIVFIVLFSVLPAAAQVNWQEEGERLTFSVGMGFIKIGKAEFLFKPEEEKYQITARAWTNKGASALFVMRDRISVSGVHASEGFLTNTYDLQLNENDYRADKKVTYLREKNSAQYQNIRSSEKPVDYTIQPNTRDVLSALYYLRKNRTDAQPGTSSVLPVFDLERQYETEVRVEKREKLRTIFGRVQTLKVRLYMKEIGGDDVKDDWTFWVTDDGKFTPVKIKVSLPIGSFGAHLIKIGSATSQSYAPEGFGEHGEVVVPARSRYHANPLED